MARSARSVSALLRLLDGVLVEGWDTRKLRSVRHARRYISFQQDFFYTTFRWKTSARPVCSTWSTVYRWPFVITPFSSRYTFSHVSFYWNFYRMIFPLAISTKSISTRICPKKWHSRATTYEGRTLRRINFLSGCRPEGEGPITKETCHISAHFGSR